MEFEVDERLKNIGIQLADMFLTTMGKATKNKKYKEDIKFSLWQLMVAYNVPFIRLIDKKFEGEKIISIRRKNFCSMTAVKAFLNNLMENFFNQKDFYKTGQQEKIIEKGVKIVVLHPLLITDKIDFAFQAICSIGMFGKDEIKNVDSEKNLAILNNHYTKITDELFSNLVKIYEMSCSDSTKLVGLFGGYIGSVEKLLKKVGISLTLLIKKFPKDSIISGVCDFFNIFSAGVPKKCIYENKQFVITDVKE